MPRIRSGFAALLLTVGSPSYAAAQAPEPSDLEIELALELLEVMHTDSIQKMMMGAGLFDLGGSMPDLPVDVKDAVEQLYNERLAWETMRRDYAVAYAEEFTADELHQLIEFFDTPLGHRWAFGTANMSPRLAEIMQEKMAPLMMELQQLIMSRMPGR